MLQNALKSMLAADMDKEKQAAANIAANSNGGEWEEQKLKEMLTLASEEESSSETIGLQQDFVERIFRNTEEKTAATKKVVTTLEGQSLTSLLTTEDAAKLSQSHTSMIQLFYTMEERPKIVEKLKLLQSHFEAANISETTVKLIDFALAKLKLDKKKD